MIIIQEETTKNPISLIGKEAGICWGADTSNQQKNYQRGISCLNCNHGRTLEYPQIYVVLDGYSAKVIRELYTHIGGAPTRLQASTRYINYGEFNYVTPPSIKDNPEAKEKYEWLMYQISDTYKDLEVMGIPKEDISNILPLGMTTKVVWRTNLRNLLDMFQQRLCQRAYWEYRIIMRILIKELSNYSEEWEYLLTHYAKCKCDVLGYCPEDYSCGKKTKRQ